MGLHMEDSGYNPLCSGSAGSSMFSLEFVVASFSEKTPELLHQPVPAQVPR